MPSWHLSNLHFIKLITQITLKARQSRLYCAHFTFREFDVCWEGGPRLESGQAGSAVIELGEGFTLARRQSCSVWHRNLWGLDWSKGLRQLPGDFSLPVSRPVSVPPRLCTIWPQALMPLAQRCCPAAWMWSWGFLGSSPISACSTVIPGHSLRHSWPSLVGWVWLLHLKLFAFLRQNTQQQERQEGSSVMASERHSHSSYNFSLGVIVWGSIYPVKKRPSYRLCLPMLHHCELLFSHQ